MIRVLVVDDQDLVRAGFSLILSAETDLEVVGEARDGAAAIAAAARLRPDVVLMDVQMPGTDGIAATRAIVADSHVRVVVVTTFDRDDYLFAALQAGASGFLLKNASPEELLSAVRVVAAGEALLDPAVTSRVIRGFATPRGSNGAGDRLTDREREVLVLIARGRSNTEIAAALFVGEATVKTHVSHLLTKLNARDRVHLVVHAYQSGLVAVGEAG